MRKLTVYACSLQLFLLASNGAFGQLPAAKMESTTKSSSEIQGLESYKKPEAKSSTTTPLVLPEPVAPPSQVAQHSDYLHPGILVDLNGSWQGSDHLLNIASNIGVYVQVIKPEGEKLDVTEAQLQKQVESIFGTANIKPLTLAAEDKPPLPAFQIEIFIYPIDRGYAAFLDGRLFESVVLDRFKMDSNMAFQAITWEKQSLIVSPKAKFAEQLTKAVQDVAGSFVTRYQTFEKLKQSSLR